MTTDPTPTACEQVMAALAKMTPGELTIERCTRADYHLMDADGACVATIYLYEDDDAARANAAGIVTLKNLTPVLAADYLREKAGRERLEQLWQASQDDLWRAAQERDTEKARADAAEAALEAAYRRGYVEGAEDALEEGEVPHMDTQNEGWAEARAALAQKGTQHG